MDEGDIGTGLRYLLPVACALCVACTGSRDRVTFCSGGRVALFSEAFTIDFASGRVISSGTASTISFVEDRRYHGLTEPLALVVPSERLVQAGLPISWELDGYKFVARSTDRARRIAVRASAARANDPRRGNVIYTLQYSYKSGVISLRKDGEIMGKKFVSELYPCMGEKLDLTRVPRAELK
jgi:hypothetical protein